LQPLPAARFPQLPSGNGLMVRGARCSATGSAGRYPRQEYFAQPRRCQARSTFGGAGGRRGQARGASRCGQRAGRAKAQEQEQEAAKAQADKLQKEKQRQDNCNRARQAKATLASGRLLSHVNAKGERGFMDEAARDAEIKRADAVIASDCGPMAEPAQ
jgi:hypothetical protein